MLNTILKTLEVMDKKVDIILKHVRINPASYSIDPNEMLTPQLPPGDCPNCEFNRQTVREVLHVLDLYMEKGHMSELKKKVEKMKDNE